MRGTRPGEALIFSHKQLAKEINTMRPTYQPTTHPYAEISIQRPIYQDNVTDLSACQPGARSCVGMALLPVPAATRAYRARPLVCTPILDPAIASGVVRLWGGATSAARNSGTKPGKRRLNTRVRRHMWCRSLVPGLVYAAEASRVRASRVPMQCFGAQNACQNPKPTLRRSIPFAWEVRRIYYSG